MPAMDMLTKELVLQRYTPPPGPTMRDIVAVMFRQRLTILVAFSLVVIAVLISGVWVPKYESQMKIMVQRQRQDTVITSSANAPTQFSGDQVSEEDLNSEVELLNSEDLLSKVVQSTGLSGDYDSHTDRASEVRIANAVRGLGRDLKIEPLRKSNVISVRYQNRDPRTAAKVLQTLAAAYLEKHLEVHNSYGELKFFDQQTEQYQRGLEQAQKKLSDFTKETGVVSAEIERNSALQRANEFDSTAHDAQTTLIETEQRVRVLQAQLQAMQPRMTTVVRTSDNPQLLEQLKSTLLGLEIKRTDLLTKYEPSYRLVQEVDQQITDTKNAISAEENQPIREESSDQDPDYLWVRTELTKAQSELSGLKARVATAASFAEEYHRGAQRIDQKGLAQQDLLRAAKTQEESYLLYLRKREEARISDALDQRGILNVALAEQPIVPALPSKSPLSIGLLTLLLAVTFSVSTAVMVDFVDPSFRTPDELANYLNMPVLAALPKSGE